MSERQGLAVAAAAALVVWLGVNGGALAAEAFDDQAYFTVGLPALAIVCAVLGYQAPSGAWRYGFAAAAVHAAALVTSAVVVGGGPLLPLGLLLLAGIGALLGLAGRAGARARQKAQPPPRG